MSAEKDVNLEDFELCNEMSKTLRESSKIITTNFHKKAKSQGLDEEFPKALYVAAVGNFAEMMENCVHIDKQEAKDKITEDVIKALKLIGDKDE